MYWSEQDTLDQMYLGPKWVSEVVQNSSSPKSFLRTKQHQLSNDANIREDWEVRFEIGL